MTDQREVQRVWTKALGALALGAALMYTLDPDKGRRRRAVARDKAYSVLLDAREAVGVTRRDIAHRLDGLRARVDRLVRRRPAPDDLQLIERVRARMGRLVSHPHAIQVGANRGKVTLSGPILAREAGPLLDTLRGVWGVAEIEDRLVAHEHPEHVPSLQGGIEPRRPRPLVMQENWPPALRAAALAGGAMLALYGMRQRSLAGCLYTAAGVAVALRGGTNRSLGSLVDAAIAGGERDRTLDSGTDDVPETPRKPGGPSIYDAPEQSSGSGLH
jgi:hypothetical protein